MISECRKYYLLILYLFIYFFKAFYNIKKIYLSIIILICFQSKPLIVKDLFVAPTFEELNIVSLDTKGNPQSLTEKQLKSIRETG